jgi:hypothetical protein
VERQAAFYANRKAGRPSRFPTAGRKKNGAIMKLATVSKSLMMGLALLLASSAFASTKGHLQLLAPTTVNGTQLKAGDYNVQWEGTGPEVQVSIMQGKKVLTTVPAKIVELKTKSENDSAVISNKTDGTSSLEGVRFRGKTTALELSESSDGMQAGSAK